jgi:FkbM family methyltransferase
MLAAVKQLVARTLPRVYTPRVKQVSQLLGLHGFFVFLYNQLLIFFTSVGYRFATNTKPIQVGEIDAEFYVDSRIEYDRVTTMIGEKAVLESFVEDINPGERVWDVGANVGTYSIVGALATEGGGEAVAFEPHPENATRINENAELNSVNNLQIERVALDDKDGTTSLYIHGDEAGAGQHSLIDEGDGAVQVDLRRGDSFIANGSSVPNVVKVDVEGAEIRVLDGMSKILEDENCRVLFVEVHHQHDVTNAEVNQRLHAAGFETESIEERGDTTFLRATKPDSANEPLQ